MHSGGEAQNSVADFYPQYAIRIGRSEERWPSEGIYDGGPELGGVLLSKLSSSSSCSKSSMSIPPG
jgi:hypothetical protein